MLHLRDLGAGRREQFAPRPIELALVRDDELAHAFPLGRRAAMLAHLEAGGAPTTAGSSAPRARPVRSPRPTAPSDGACARLGSGPRAACSPSTRCYWNLIVRYPKSRTRFE